MSVAPRKVFDAMYWEESEEFLFLVMKRLSAQSKTVLYKKIKGLKSYMKDMETDYEETEEMLNDRNIPVYKLKQQALEKLSLREQQALNLT